MNKSVVLDNRITIDNFNHNDFGLPFSDHEKKGRFFQQSRKHWESISSVYCTRNELDRGFAYTSCKQQIVCIPNGTIFSRLKFSLRSTVKFKEDGIFVYEFYKRPKNKHLYMYHARSPHIESLPNDIKNCFVNDFIEYTYKYYAIDLSNIQSIIRYGDEKILFYYAMYPILRPTIENNQMVEINCFDVLYPFRRNNVWQTCQELFGKRMVSRPVIRHFAQSLYDNKVYNTANIRVLRRHIDRKYLDSDLFREIYLNNIFDNGSLIELQRRNKGRINRGIKRDFDVLFSTLNRTRLRKIFLNVPIQSSNLIDMVSMFSTYQQAFGVDASIRISSGAKTVHELHNRLSTELRKLEQMNYIIDVDEYEYLDNIETDNGYRLVKPKDTDTLVDWSSKGNLDNCLHTYRKHAISGEFLFLGIKDNKDKLIGALAIESNTKKIMQIEGKSGQALPVDVHLDIIRLLESKGVNCP